MSEHEKMLWGEMLSKEKAKQIDAKYIARIPITEELLVGSSIYFFPPGMIEVND